MAPALESGFVDSDGERIFWESVGEGDALILGHGLGGNHASWYQQVPAFAERYRVVTWDQRGFGNSTDHNDAANPESALRDLLALCDGLGIERAHVVGQSMGGWAALGFGLRHPERVRSLVLADTLGGIWTDLARREFDAYVQRMLKDPPGNDIARHPALGDQLGREDPARAFLYRTIAGLGGPPPPAMALHLRRTAWDLDQVAAFARPVLLVVGDADPIFPPAVIEDAAARLPDARVARVERAGHSPYFERPEAWNEAVGAFLKEAGSR